MIANIKEAMTNIEAVSCVKFKLAPNDLRKHVLITFKPKQGCSSEIGYHDRQQFINLDTNACNVVGDIMHQLMHTLGFMHQQSLPNRDDYVRIARENIKADKLKHFDKYEHPLYTNFNEDYDYSSLMHLPEDFQSANGNLTIEALYPEDAGLMGQNQGLSPTDVRKLNVLYECKEKTKDWPNLFLLYAKGVMTDEK